jgi:hypothetical protein
MRRIMPAPARTQAMNARDREPHRNGASGRRQGKKWHSFVHRVARRLVGKGWSRSGLPAPRACWTSPLPTLRRRSGISQHHQAPGEKPSNRKR